MPTRSGVDKTIQTVGNKNKAQLKNEYARVGITVRGLLQINIPNYCNFGGAPKLEGDGIFIRGHSGVRDFFIILERPFEPELRQRKEMSILCHTITSTLMLPDSGRVVLQILDKLSVNHFP